jgi:hypothetical protein
MLVLALLRYAFFFKRRDFLLPAKLESNKQQHLDADMQVWIKHKAPAAAAIATTKQSRTPDLYDQ